MLKVLVLDFDGVLNSRKYDNTRLSNQKGISLDPKSIKLINEILEFDPEIQILISSSWVKTYSLNELTKILEDKFLIKNRIIDCVDSSLKKAEAIESWIENKNPNSFCIVDDEWLFNLDHPYQKHFVKIGTLEGLLDKHLDVILSQFI